MLEKRNQKGFTLMEMLIVVAIIAILVAVSIPVFTSQLDKAKTATDDANVRAAKAVAVSQYLTGEYTVDGLKVTTAITYPYTVYYNATNGALASTAAKAIVSPETTGYGKSSANNGDVIKIKIAAAGTVTTSWVPIS